MTQMLAGKIAVEAVFYSVIAFTAAVSVFWPWWKSQLGWTIIAKSVALAFAVLPAMLVYWFGPGAYKEIPWLGWVAVAAIATIPPILAWRGLVIWHAQRKARDML